MIKSYEDIRKQSKDLYHTVSTAAWNPFRPLHRPWKLRPYLRLERAALDPSDDVQGVLDGMERALSEEEDGQERQNGIGLALSGGGIRSATYNLGLLQGLHKLGLLPAFDYMATVSGGGYIGGFWTRWRARGGRGFPIAEAGADEAEAPEVRALREHGNFLSPRLGLTSADTMRMMVAVLAGTLPAFVATVAMLVLGSWAWHHLLALTLWGGEGSGPRLALTLGAITAVVLASSESRLRKRSGERPSLVYAVAGVVGLTLFVATTWLFGARLVGPEAVAGGYVLSWIPPLEPKVTWASARLAALWIAPALLFLTLRTLLSRFTSGPQRVRVRNAFDRVTGRLLFVAGGWLMGLALWGLAFGAYDFLDGSRWGAYGAGTLTVAGAFAWLRRRVRGLLGSGGVMGRLRELVGRRLPAFLAWAASALLVVGVAGGYIELFYRQGGGDILHYAIIGALAVTGLTLVAFDPNRIGLHSFYRGRIARTFLGASHRGRSATTDEVATDDIPLSDLATLGRPLHLVCTTANDLSAPDPLAGLGRGGCSAVLSPVGFSVGDTARRWNTRELADAPTLAAALTASAAAFNPMMGAQSQRFGRAAGFLMAALNLRLGRWVRHPAQRSGASKHWALPGFLFYRELFGFSHAREASVHLSDGGHFENMAAYELIRRRCRYIIVSDCGADPRRTFSDLANLIRLAREDLGVEIDIDLSELRPDDQGRSRHPVVAGDIFYPNDTRGVILLFKPGVTGSEPPDIGQYLSGHPDFPHETTLDQFYDMAQWESYRRLGEHAVTVAFSFARGSAPWWPDKGMETPELARRSAPSLFAQARFRWLPGQIEVGTRLAAVSASLAELDALLDRPDNELLSAQVNRLEELAVDDASAPHETVPEAPVLRSAASAVRRAFAICERVYLELDLESTHALPANLGVINRFRRWTAAPLVRFWWPVLRSRHSPAFIHFVERTLGLTTPELDGAPVRLTPVSPEAIAGDPGYAAYCWRLRNPRLSREDGDGRYLLFDMPLVYGTRVLRLQVGVLRYWSIDRGHLGRLAVWNADDLFIADGVWGTGLGGRFLGQLVQPDSPLADHAALAVLGAERETGGFELYWETGFETYQELTLLIPAARDQDRVRKVVAAGRTKGVTFLVRTPEPGELARERAPAGS